MYIVLCHHLVVDVIITCTLYRRQAIINDETDELIQFYSDRFKSRLDLSLSEIHLDRCADAWNDTLSVADRIMRMLS